jgi:hypothetical protein
MSTDINANLRSPRSHKQALSSVPLILVAAVLVLVASTPAFAQMGNSVTYSDSWLVYDSNPGYVMGSGVTSDNYNSYGHRYWVTTTLRSPSGRTASGTSYMSGSYARMDVSLSWDYQSDFGDFTTTTNHSMSCPYMYGTIVTTTTTVGLTVGASSITFQNSGVRDSQNRCIMNMIQPCNVACTGRQQTNEVEPCSPYSVWIEPWYKFGQGSFICIGFFFPELERHFGADNSQPCFES